MIQRLGKLSDTLLAPLASGLLLAVAFPSPSLFPLAWLAFVPFLSFLLDRPGWGKLLAGHFIFCLAFLGGVLSWIPMTLYRYGGLSPPWAGIAFLLLVFVLGLLLVPFPIVLRLLAERGWPGVLLAAPACWGLVEMVRNQLPFTGFPWALLGHTQYPFLPLAQMVDLLGVFGLSVLVMAINASLLAWLRFDRTRPIVALLGAVGLFTLYGAIRLEFWKPEPIGHLRVGLLQPDIAMRGGLEHYSERYFSRLPELHREAIRQGSEWVIFPEAPNPYRFPDDFYFRTFWSETTQESGVPLLLNAISKSDDRYYNSAFLLGPDGTVAFQYNKMLLVPFGEYLPYGGFGLIPAALVGQVSHFSSGSEMRLGAVAGAAFTVLICYEIIFPDLGRSAVESGSSLLVNISNDRWFGRSSAPRQHLELAAFRAIETRKPVLRATNSGFTAFIDAKGRIQSSLGLGEEGVLVGDVEPNLTRSFYSRYGDWPLLFIIISTLSVACLLKVRS